MRLLEFYSKERECSYTDSKQSTFRYFYIQNVAPTFYYALLERGWRRFGISFFTPMCNGCTDCISIRTLINDFIFSRNHKRLLKKAEKLDIFIQRPSLTQAHVELYNRYHHKMQEKKGWQHSPISPEQYVDTFVDGYRDFGYEILYYFHSKLIGVGLVDALFDSISATYFYYDHDFSEYSLGTLNILKQIELGRENGLKYFYPGYWIKNHYSMGYKERFMPFEVLKNIPDIFEEPIWEMYRKEQD